MPAITALRVFSFARLPQKLLNPVDNSALIAEIKSLYDAGLLMVEIAKRVGRDLTTVRKLLDGWFRDNNVPRLDGRNRRKALEIKTRPKPPK